MSHAPVPFPAAPADQQVHDQYAREQDAADALRSFREEFFIPRAADVGGQGLAPGEACVYLVGNSLGLQPKGTRAAMEEDLDAWARLGVEGHFHAAHPWFPAHEEVRDMLARVVGALPREVVAMNTLTTNLHLLMVSFYRPTRERYKIVIEDTAFPSDSYAVKSQLEFHSRHCGFDPRGGLIRLKAREGEQALRTEDILAAIDREKGSIALVMLGGVNYLTGQLFDIRGITSFARERGIVVGWDLAHAAGNIDLKLHDDGPDFAAWCSYKYLNSGPGSIAGLFVHERHLGALSSPAQGGPAVPAGSQVSIGTKAPAGTAGPPMPRFSGWWGNDPKVRFKMGPDFEPVGSADAWALSNPPIFALTPLRASLEVFDRAGMGNLRAKSVRLTGYLASLIDGLNARPGAGRIGVLTPRDAGARGTQLSLVLPGDARGAFTRLQRAGVVCDFREPNVVRAAPVPLYCGFGDVLRFARVLGGLA